MNDDIEEPNLIRMSPEGFTAFLATCSEPGAPVPEMVEVIRRPAPWEQGQHPCREEEEFSVWRAGEDKTGHSYVIVCAI